MAAQKPTWLDLALGPRKASLELAHGDGRAVPARFVVRAADESRREGGKRGWGEGEWGVGKGNHMPHGPTVEFDGWVDED